MALAIPGKTALQKRGIPRCISEDSIVARNSVGKPRIEADGTGKNSLPQGETATGSISTRRSNEQSDEWQVTRKYMSQESLRKVFHPVPEQRKLSAEGTDKVA